MKRKIIVTKKFPFVELRKIEKKSWSEQFKHMCRYELPDEQWKLIELYDNVDLLRNLKDGLKFVTNFKFENKDEYYGGEIRLQFCESCSRRENKWVFRIEYDYAEEKQEIQQILIKVLKKKIAEKENKIAELKREIASK